MLMLSFKYFSNSTQLQYAFDVWGYFLKLSLPCLTAP